MNGRDRVDPQDIVGSIHGELEVMKYIGRKMYSNGCSVRLYECKCSCGRTIQIHRQCLTTGNQKHCKSGVHSSRLKHGECQSPTYRSHNCMLSRCYNPNSKAYKNYGAIGITVCKKWHNYINFRTDMGERPAGTSLERINNSKGYSPDNCKWATRFEQSRNTRRSRKITAFGKTQCLVDWAAETGLSMSAIKYRLVQGWDVEFALTREANGEGKHNRYVEYQGKSYTYSNLAKKLHVSMDNLRYRLKNGYPVEIAVSKKRLPPGILATRFKESLWAQS